MYIRQLLKYAKENDLFYLRPLSQVPIATDSLAPWYTKLPVGRDALNNKFKIMCEQANVKGNKTNHRLRATGATHLHESGVPEKIIKERTGHRSFEALRMYERTNESQHKAVSSLLCAPSKTLHGTEMQRVMSSTSTKTVKICRIKLGPVAAFHSKICSVVQSTSTLYHSSPVLHRVLKVLSLSLTRSSQL